MDTNAGRFVEEKSAEAWMQRVEVGEVVKIKGEELRIVVIEDRRITLELLSADDRMRTEAEARSALADMRAGLIEQRDDRNRSKRGVGFIGGKPGR